MADVFISYVGEDRSLAETLAGALETSGYSVWWDRELHGGADFAAEIEKQLTNAPAVIVVWSKASRDSKWVRDEASYARDKNKLVPVRIDESQPPLGFRQLQSIELAGWKGDVQRPSFAHLLASLADFVAAMPSPKDAGRRPLTRRTSRTAIALVAAIGLIGVVVATYRLVGEQDPAVETNGSQLDAGTVLVQPISTVDPALTAVADLVTNDLVRAISATSLHVQRGTSPGTQSRAGYSVEGSLQRVDAAQRLSLQLTGVASGQIEWADSFVIAPDETVFDGADYTALMLEQTIGALTWGCESRDKE